MEEEKEEKLYIPVNVVDSNDFISGFGNKELTITGIVFAVSLISAILLWMNTENIIAAIILFFTAIAFTILMIVRDQYDESMIDKIRLVRNYYKAQKKFEYRYHNIYEGKKNGTGKESIDSK